MKLAGWTCCKEDSFLRQENPPRIDDATQSGIILSNKFDFVEDDKLHLAHELGHILIQNGNEHLNGNESWPSDNLMNLGATDSKLEAVQFIEVLRLKRSDKNLFLSKEEGE